jgi:hypothetical protein
VPSTANKTVTSTGVAGTCAAGSTAVALPAGSKDQQTLLSILPHLSFQPSGVGGKPTIVFSGVNLQLINGAGSETALNGEGNLVIGYNTGPGEQTGSHNLVMGTTGQAFAGDGGIEGGANNQLTNGGSVVFGDGNQNDGFAASLLGGSANSASGQEAAILGGGNNIASGVDSVVTGGSDNNVSAPFGEGGTDISHLISLKTDWAGDPGFGASGASCYTDSSGIVHLDGAVSRSSGSTSNVIGSLPSGCSPPTTRTVYTIVHTFEGTYADLSIGTDGTINVLPSSNTNASFVSLEGITYRP